MPVQTIVRTITVIESCAPTTITKGPSSGIVVTTTAIVQTQTFAVPDVTFIATATGAAPELYYPAPTGVNSAKPVPEVYATPSNYYGAVVPVSLAPVSSSVESASIDRPTPVAVSVPTEALVIPVEIPSGIDSDNCTGTDCISAIGVPTDIAMHLPSEIISEVPTAVALNLPTEILSEVISAVPTALSVIPEILSAVTEALPTEVLSAVTEILPTNVLSTIPSAVHLSVGDCAGTDCPAVAHGHPAFTPSVHSWGTNGTHSAGPTGLVGISSSASDTTKFVVAALSTLVSSTTATTAPNAKSTSVSLSNTDDVFTGAATFVSVSGLFSMMAVVLVVVGFQL